MSRTTWSVPMAAVRYGLTIDASATLMELAAQRATFEESALVELTPHGFVALVIYALPGAQRQVRHAHLSLAWAPPERRAAA